MSRRMGAFTLAGLGSPAWADTMTLSADVWGDNWYAFYAHGAKVAEDTKPYHTERSFNAANHFTVAADTPVTLAFEFRDFMQDDTGVEYVDTHRQRMGDGGAIARFIWGPELHQDNIVLRRLTIGG